LSDWRKRIPRRNGFPLLLYHYYYHFIFSSPFIWQIYKWVDEEGIIHFTDDPSKIPEKYISQSEKSKQDVTISPSIEVEESKDDLKQPIGQKSNEMTPIQRVGKVYKEKSIRNLVYLIGLFIILLILIKILREPRPAEVLKGPFISRKRPKIIFDVYYRDYSTDSMVFLGKIIEMRRKERGNNFKDLLFKARQNYSTRVKDPSAIFLLSS
jgi:hypothetical protein